MEPWKALKMPLEDFGPLWKDPVGGTVRRPPPLQSILRLQQTVGNRAAQRMLGIGDGRMELPVTSAPPEPVAPPKRIWTYRIAALAGRMLHRARHGRGRLRHR